MSDFVTAETVGGRRIAGTEYFVCLDIMSSPWNRNTGCLKILAALLSFANEIAGFTDFHEIK